MNNYSFSRLIKKYSVKVMVKERIPSDNNFDVDGEPIKSFNHGVEKSLVIIPFDMKTINSSGGLIKQSDRQIYSLFQLSDGTTITHENMDYKIDTSINFAPFGDFYRYMAKGVKSFDPIS